MALPCLYGPALHAGEEGANGAEVAQDAHCFHAFAFGC